MLSHTAADVGFIILPPLAALVFLGIGRHPLVGMFAAFAGVAGDLQQMLCLVLQMYC